jgi:phage terminase large subunit-like protein
MNSELISISDESLNKAIAENCRRSFFYFIQEFWDVVIPEKAVWNWHIEYLANECQKVALGIKGRKEKEGDIIINIPPGTSKSTIFSVMFPSWIWTIDPTIRVLTASNSDTLSLDLSVKSKDIVESEKYKAYFPEIQLRSDISSKSHYKNTLGGERLATSTGASVIGFHAHLIIVDDPIDAKKAVSDAFMIQANNFMNKVLSTRKVDKENTVTILVMQRLHENDPSGNWLSNKDKKIVHYCLPAELSENVKPYHLREMYKDGLLDVVRLNRNALSILRADLGSYGYSGQIMQTPSPESGGIWQKWFKIIERKDIPTLKNVGTDWDTAYTDKEENAANAYVTSGTDNESNIYITDSGYFWAETPELIMRMKTKQSPHYIEAKASGKSAVQFLNRDGINAIEIQVDGGDKISRTRLVTPTAEAGRVYVASDLIDLIYNDDKQGILSFPKNSHKDLNDAIVQALQRHSYTELNFY